MSASRAELRASGFKRASSSVTFRVFSRPIKGLDGENHPVIPSRAIKNT